MTTLTDFLLARIAEDEAAAKACAEMFPPPWEVADRGWRVRIYAGDVPEENFFVDDPDAMTTRNPVVIEVEPDRHIQDPKWLSERVDHIVRHDPARVLADCEARRRIVSHMDICSRIDGPRGDDARSVLAWIAAAYADHPDFRECRG